MKDLNDLKILSYEKGVSDLSDTPNTDGMTSGDLKAVFDARSNKEIKEKHNALVEYIEGGAPGEGDMLREIYDVNGRGEDIYDYVDKTALTRETYDPQGINADIFEYVKDYVDENAAAAEPGAIGTYAGPRIPDGWLGCDGAFLTKNAYNNLFGAIGVRYGSSILNETLGTVSAGAGAWNGIRRAVKRPGSDQLLVQANSTSGVGSGSGNGVYYSESIQTLFVFDSSAIPFIKLFEFSMTGTPVSVEYNKNGTRLMILTNSRTANNTYYFDCTTSTYTALTAPLPALASNCVCIEGGYSPDGTRYIRLSGNTGVSNPPQVDPIIYSISGDVFTQVAVIPKPASATVSRGFAWKHNMSQLCITWSAAPFLRVYNISGDTYTAIADVSTLTSSLNKVAYSPDSTKLFAWHVPEYGSYDPNLAAFDAAQIPYSSITAFPFALRGAHTFKFHPTKQTAVFHNLIFDTSVYPYVQTGTALGECGGFTADGSAYYSGSANAPFVSKYDVLSDGTLEVDVEKFAVPDYRDMILQGWDGADESVGKRGGNIGMSGTRTSPPLVKYAIKY